MISRNSIRILLVMLALLAASATFYVTLYTPHSLLETLHEYFQSENTNMVSHSHDTEPQEFALNDPSKTLIFNLNGVLFKEDLGRIIKKVGFTRLAKFAVSNWKNPVDSCLDILEKMALEQKTKNSCCLLYQGRQLPSCITEWQLGTQTHAQVQSALNNYIDHLDSHNYFSCSNEKEVSQCIINMAFNPQEISEISKPVTAMVRIIEQLKKKGYRLYVFADMPHEVRTTVSKTYATFIDLFDGILISAEAQALTSDKKFFKHLIKKHGINPKTSFVIDEGPDSLKVAKSLGMKSIAFTNAKSLKNSLKKLGLL